MERPLISIIVPVRDSGETITDCVSSLLRQDYQADRFEIIVADNGSSDGTLPRLEAFWDLVRIVREPRKGSYRARNAAAAASEGSLLAFTDADCVAHPSWLSGLAAAFRDRRVKVAGGPILGIEADNLLQRYCARSLKRQDWSVSAPQPYFAGSNLAMRKRALEDAGGFDDSLLSGGDFEVCSRMVENRREIKYEPGAKVRCRHPATLQEFARKQFFYGRWSARIRQRTGKWNHMRMPGYLSVMGSGIGHLLPRLVQDAAYKTGWIWGLAQERTQSVLGERKRRRRTIAAPR